MYHSIVDTFLILGNFTSLSGRLPDFLGAKLLKHNNLYLINPSFIDGFLKKINTLITIKKKHFIGSDILFMYCGDINLLKYTAFLSSNNIFEKDIKFIKQINHVLYDLIKKELTNDCHRP